MLYPGPINNLCFLLTFMNTLKFFNVTHLPLFYTNKFNQYTKGIPIMPFVSPFYESEPGFTHP